MPSSHSPDTLVVAFDGSHAVANAGLLLSATLANAWDRRRSWISWSTWRPPWRPPARRQGPDLVQAILAGADRIDDADVLRTEQTTQVLGTR